MKKTKEVEKLQFVEFKKFNMKCEIERMEIIYTFYFFAFFEKVIKKLLTFCYWWNRMGFIGILLLKEERRQDGEFRRLKIKIGRSFLNKR